MNKSLPLLLIANLLMSCGGGNKTSDNLSKKNPPASPQVVSLDEEIKTAQAIELILLAPDDNISDIHWQQTAGESVTFLAQTSKVIAFTTENAGEYHFSVSFTLNDGTRKTLQHSIDVSQNSALLSARLGHAALEGSKVSLRASLAANLSSNSIAWQQITGPDVSFTENNIDGDYAVFFTAPEVAQDTILSFQVSASDGNINHTDVVSILVENAQTIDTLSDDLAYTERLARVFPYVRNSAYSDVLVDCVYSNDIVFSNTCRLNQLPLIAQDNRSPSIDDIMARVVVSHHWMGKRFREFLENFDINNDFKNLLRATTAIVISYDIRPSYYWVVTGAIHLDANNLWLTPDERDTINQAPDYRANFGDELNFVMPWRYVKNNNYTTTFIDDNVRISRLPEDGLYNLVALMYHELAHANDFFPQTSWQNLAEHDEILMAADKLFSGPGIKSDQLQQIFPLKGEEMFQLAQVRFHGQSATPTQKSYYPNDVSHFFNTESAPQFYNYASIREDYAMLFDGFMMQTRYGISRDIAITNQPQSEFEDYIVSWGQRGRIGEESIKPRVVYAVTNILPEFTEAETMINNLPEPINMNRGKSWYDNLAISPGIPAKANKINPLDSSKNSRTFIPQYFYEKPIPLSKLSRN